MKVKICPGGGIRIYDEKQDAGLAWHEAQAGVLPTGIERMRLTCPKCGRRVWSALRVCHDGCCVFHVLPPHKVKKWWKKKATTGKSKKRR